MGQFGDNIVKRFIFLLLALVAVFGIFVFYTLYIHKRESIANELSGEIENFKSEKGHYPHCDNSIDLIDSLKLNGNEWYPEYFSYHLDKTGQHYTIKIYEDNKVAETFNSRTREITKVNEKSN